MQVVQTFNRVWDVATQTWVAETQPLIDGGSVTLSGSVGISSLPNEGQQTMANSISVAVASDQKSPAGTAYTKSVTTASDSLTVYIGRDGYSSMSMGLFSVGASGYEVFATGVIGAFAAQNLPLIGVNSGLVTYSLTTTADDYVVPCAGFDYVSIHVIGLAAGTLHVDAYAGPGHHSLPWTHLRDVTTGEEVKSQTSSPGISDRGLVVRNIPKVSITGTTSSVSDSNVNQTLLSANASRLGATIYNDSTVLLYIKCGATASATDFTVRVDPQGFYETPFGFIGRIDGIWASDASGAARITEFT